MPLFFCEWKRLIYPCLPTSYATVLQYTTHAKDFQGCPKYSNDMQTAGNVDACELKMMDHSRYLLAHRLECSLEICKIELPRADKNAAALLCDVNESKHISRVRLSQHSIEDLEICTGRREERTDEQVTSLTNGRHRQGRVATQRDWLGRCPLSFVLFVHFRQRLFPSRHHATR